MWVGRFIPAKNLPIKTRVDLLRLFIFLGRGGEGWYLFLCAINNANAGVGGLSWGGRWAGVGEKGTKIASVSFSSRILYST